ncbi:MAG: GNAT family N-acetyltransferase [Clostridiales bacterium]|nr:GNAT family N-acetyltransferase [Clostridiales bacterium]
MFLEKVYLGIEKQKRLHDTEANDNDGYLSHHGVKGMHWGIRRYQNPDGSLTKAGKLRYSVKSEADIVKSKATTKYLPFKAMPINKDTVKARGMLTDEEADKCISLANKLFDKASKEEPKITNDILDVVKKSNATMYGLDYRLKQPTSIAAKIGSDSKSDGISMEQAASGINDTIRYTVLANDKNFTDTYRSVQQSLTEKGYSERKCKNFFEGFKNGKVSHKAVQSSYQSPDGMIFEVQFQTPLSQAAKELKVPLYEEVRQASTSPSRREYLIGQMNALANNVSDPPNVFDIPSFSASSKVKHSGVFGERVLRPHDDETYLAHHGVKGQQWGIKNGPPYPLHRDAAYNTANDISTKNWMRINEFYKSMSYKDRKLIDPDSTYEPENYFKSLDHYKKTTAYNFISDDGFLVAEKIPKNQNVDDTNGVEIGIGVKNKSKGVGTKMVSDLVDWFDNQNDIDTMWWPVDKSNKASIRVAEKNGFIKDPIGDNYIYAKDSAYEKLGINNKRKEPAKSSNDILKQYDNQTLTKDAIREYKSQAPQLSHVRVNKNTTGELYFKNGKLAGMVNTEKKDDGTVWIQGIEVYGDNQGKGLGYSMLDHAVKDLGATNLSVNKKNNRAKMIYDKYGFETYDEDSTMYYMKYE